MPLLHAGDAFPRIESIAPDGTRTVIPDAFAGGYGVVLLYPGPGCRRCVEHLHAYQRALERLHRAGADVIALSADDADRTAAMIDEHALAFPIGYGADPAAVHEATGSFVSIDPPILQSTAFVLDRDGRVLVSLYSCGSIGQLLPDDVLELIEEVES